MYYSFLYGLYLFISSVNASESSNGLPGTTYTKWTWTEWFDTDSGDLETEIETYDSIVARGWSICRGGKLIGCECKRDDTKEILSNGAFFNTSHILGTDLECKLHGIECHNVLCMNLEVRFLCEDVILESGSAVFYFLMLIIPVLVILFRLYCWSIVKKQIWE
ncbi:mucin-5B-like [Mytilus galloprovincialis]|uniref:mucin-5B-like n=1 Tax=Mytilus galloprovincialis TaxID=29158 RepID=UPI003F7BFF3E